jgi:AraC family cel operon transcriptional repressor
MFIEERLVKPIQISINNFIDNPNYNYASIIDDPNQLKVEHFHNYYELFIVNEGTAKHNVNGSIEQLQKGDLVFIRPDDAHNYEETSKRFSIINILVPMNAITELLNYLGPSFNAKKLLTSTLPPMVHLDQNEFNEVIADLEQLVLSRRLSKENSAYIFRIVLMRIITKYFSPSIVKGNTNVPTWLKWLAFEMHKKENFVVGLDAMYRLSDKCPEHLSRMCKKYLNKTPTQFINEIRCEYAANLIAFSETKIIDISYDVGFGNLSHFYHCFQAVYGVAPNAFRKSPKIDQENLDVMQLPTLDTSNINKAIPLKDFY